MHLSPHLHALEAESIHILREVAAGFEKPVMLYSIGKDSSTMLHLARKAFYPAAIPFPLMHVDTTWKFREMILFRERMAKEHKLNLIVYTNPAGHEDNVTPFTYGSARYTDIMKTEALRQALDKYGFDAAIGGARRDEEKSRAKERIFSVRASGHRWNARNQRAELWRLYNTRLGLGETMRVFPLSNWTELDVWEYILAESIPIVPLYFTKERPVIRRSGAWIMIDNPEKMVYEPGESLELRRIRFRTLGCWPLSGAIESEAESVADIVAEIRGARYSERQGRLIDSDQAGSMEKKKQAGYF
ncbi:MAG: sulfate adenylyltransferase subunit CysD [Deltaproteobacteria bacterium]|jgi:sulfate adenylyltransferase subunit 2|nr:sulfate adenylyltransferase subunit CysD [Deltaproteobacteria bacterium]